MGPSNLVRLLRDLEESGLIATAGVRGGRVGRPVLKVQTTDLGKEYLNLYDRLGRTKLVSRRSDLLRASHDAAYVARLEANGVSPYSLFFELNTLARRP
jgi:DNA-binding PadR family transcriptional regulator